jgi:hypothetical protein
MRRYYKSEVDYRECVAALDAVLRLHDVLDALTRLNLQYQESRSKTDRLGKEFDLACRKLKKHRRTHLKAC